MNIPQTLRERLRAGKVIPFVGAGVSMAVVNQETGKRLFPSWRELLLSAADRLEQEHKPAPAGLVRSFMEMGRARDYLSAAEEARDALGPVWFRFLKDRFDPERKQVADDSLALARLVWGLNSDLIVTTNYDNVLRWAHPSGVDVKVWNIQAVAEQADLLHRGVDRPTVWHLHGHIDEAARLILTPGGYSLLYPAGFDSEVRYRAALQTLRALFASRSFLFVGYSMDDEQLTQQLERMNEVFEGTTGPHYVLVREAERDRVAALGLPVEILTFSDFGQPLVDALSDLADAASEAETSPPPEITGQSAPISPKIKSDTSTPAAVFSVPFLPKGADVVGREAALQAVRRQLVEGRRTQIGQTAAFQGLGGLGKTQLAVEYAYRFRDEYPGGVIWLTADQDIDAQLTELAPKAGWIAAESEHKYKLDVAMQRLRTHTGLLVFDNLESREAIDPYLPGRDTCAHILVTSRTEQGGFRPVPLNLLDTEESLEVLIREAGREPEGETEEVAIREIADRLGGLPLALELAGAFIRHREIGWGLYRDRLNQNPRKALTGRFLQSTTEHERDLYSTLRIDEEVFADEPLLRDILDVLAWSGPAPMGVSLLSVMLALEDSTELSDALGLGVALRLLQKSPGTDSYAIHRLVSEVWREGHPITERRKWVESCCAALGDWFQDRKENFLDLPAFEVEIDHLRAWQEHASAVAMDAFVRLLWLQAYPPYHRGQFQNARDYVSRALLLIEAQPTSDRKLLAHLLHDSGYTASALGEFRTALEYEERALAIRLELFGEQHPDTAASLNGVAATYNQLGAYQKDLEYSERALAICLELFGELHSHTADSLNSVGITYSHLGQYYKALEYTERALAIRKELFGEQHPDFAWSLESVGSVYSRLGEYQKDLLYALRGLEIRRALFGERHPDTVASLNSVGSSYSSLDDYQNALSYSEGALAICQDLFGERHPDTAVSLDNVAGAYNNLGEHKTALKFARRALAIRREVFGDRHPNTALSLDSVGSVYSNLHEFQMVLEYAQKAFEIRVENFGEKHPFTAASLKNVGSAYHNLEEYSRALEYKTRAVTSYRDLLGQTHPETVRAVLSLSLSLRSANKDAEAFKLLHDLFGKLDRTHPSYSAVKQHLQALSRKTVQPGFRQPTVGKKNQSRKKPRKRR